MIQSSIRHRPEAPRLQGMDTYEFAEPVDITKALDKAFWEGLRSAKWQERKGALQALKAAAGTPKIAPGDFVELLSELKKVLTKDSNLVCVTETVACLGAAGGLSGQPASRIIFCAFVTVKCVTYVIMLTAAESAIWARLLVVKHAWNPCLGKIPAGPPFAEQHQHGSLHAAHAGG